MRTYTIRNTRHYMEIVIRKDGAIDVCVYWNGKLLSAHTFITGWKHIAIDRASLLKRHDAQNIPVFISAETDI
jgi:hypothetical protein